MRLLRRTFYFALIATLCALVPASCMKDSVDTCIYGVNLRIDFLDIDLVAEADMRDVTILVYNSLGELVEEVETSYTAVVSNNNMVSIPIKDPDTYSFVVIGDAFSEAFTRDAKESMEDLRISLKEAETAFKTSTKNSTGTKDFSNFYHGMIRGVEVKQYSNVLVECQLMNNKKNIYVSAFNSYNGTTTKTDIKNTSISSANWQYDCYNAVPEGIHPHEYTYQENDIIIDETEWSVRIPTLRILKEKEMILSFDLKEQNGNYANRKINLSEYISQIGEYSTQEALDAEKDFFLTLNYDYKDVLISITINEWKLVLVKPEV